MAKTLCCGIEKKRLRHMMGSEEDGEDLISELPIDVLVAILSRLTLWEAVKTSVLSKRWRYVWSYITCLDFDANVNNRSWFEPPVGEIIGWDPYNSHKFRYSNWVSCVLEQHERCNIREFRVCFDLDFDFTSYIQKWMRLLLSNRVETIDINLSVEGAPFTSNMVSLYRKCADLDLPFHRPAVGFKTLKSLSLNAVYAGDYIIHNLLDCSPLLEHLSLHMDLALKNLKVVGPYLSLRKLVLVNCRSIESIQIYKAKKLVSFTYHGIPAEIFVEDVPQLAELSIDIDRPMVRVQEMFPVLSSTFSQLRILELTIHQLLVVRLQDIILPELKNLNQFLLALHIWHYYPSLLGHLATIKNWPNLQKFALQFRSPLHPHLDSMEEIETTGQMREAVTFCHPSLKVFEIAGYCDICHCEIIKQITQNSINLEKIIVDTHSYPSVRFRERLVSCIETPEADREIKINSLEQKLRRQLPSKVELVVL